MSDSGKSTCAHAVEARLYQMGYRTFMFDGDNVRHGLCSGLGFSKAHRAENIRLEQRVDMVIMLLHKRGIIKT